MRNYWIIYIIAKVTTFSFKTVVRQRLVRKTSV